MPEASSRIVVCAAEHAAAVAREILPSHVVAIGAPGTTPPAIVSPAHLALIFHDIGNSRPGLVAPTEDDVASLLAFGRSWNGKRPLLVHCRMGISRSPAAAYALACQHRPDLPEHILAARLRNAATCATPNPLIVRLADDRLGRAGRMRRAVEGIGRGADYVPVRSFTLALATAA